MQKIKKNKIVGNTNYLNNHNRNYLKILNNINKNKGIYFTNNNSKYIKKGAILKGSKSKNNIYLKNNFFNKPVGKVNKKKINK